MNIFLCHFASTGWWVQLTNCFIPTSTPFDWTNFWVSTTCRKLLIKVCFTASNIFGSEILVRAESVRFDTHVKHY